MAWNTSSCSPSDWTVLLLRISLLLSSLFDRSQSASSSSYSNSYRTLTAFDNCADYGAKMCFTCASEDMRHDWTSAYEQVMHKPANFTHFCDDIGRKGQESMSVVACTSACVTLVEPQFVFGTFVRRRYFRGCLDSMFSEQTKRLLHKLIPNASNNLQGEQCRSISRNDLFNKATLRPDNFTVCLCGCDRCNIYPDLLGSLSSKAAARGDKMIAYQRFGAVFTLSVLSAMVWL